MAKITHRATASSILYPLNNKDIRNTQASMAIRNSDPYTHNHYGGNNGSRGELERLNRKVDMQSTEIQHLTDKVAFIEGHTSTLRIEFEVLQQQLYKFNAIPKGTL